MSMGRDDSYRYLKATLWDDNNNAKVDNYQVTSYRRDIRYMLIQPLVILDGHCHNRGELLLVFVINKKFSVINYRVIFLVLFTRYKAPVPLPGTC